MTVSSQNSPVYYGGHFGHGVASPNGFTYDNGRCRAATRKTRNNDSSGPGDSRHHTDKSVYESGLGTASGRCHLGHHNVNYFGPHFRCSKHRTRPTLYMTWDLLNERVHGLACD